ncbi:unnamed protein product [Cuscuta europaea]|uniref:SWIM-type domain-containing protein n=1 Tax=Cuscuta europaea TaxID=41803 RepID=A0A9P0YBX7_CUSEU|nr:unnamed protein product [Cuscuta europaea]
MQVVFNGHDDYEVKRGRHQYQVRLEGRTCSCRVWELNGIPCSHAVCAILDNGGDPETYVDECYSKEVYQRIYSHHLQRMNGELMWKKTQQNDIQAPIPKKMTGWPKKKRKREATEGPSSATTMTRKGRVMTCFICKVAGYNKSKCPTSPMERQTQTRERKRALVKNQA